MNTASLDLCKRLYELSGWGGTVYGWHDTTLGQGKLPNYVAMSGYLAKEISAYDLGFLVRKLPTGYQLVISLTIIDKRVYYFEDYRTEERATESYDNPEDAVASLCIKLFETGVLKENQYWALGMGSSAARGRDE